MTINYSRWLRSFVGHQRLLQLAAGAFITDARGHVLLGRRTDVMLWAPPSGMVQLGDTPAGTVVREVREETGLDITPVGLIGIYSGPDFDWTYPNGDQAQIVSTFFRCETTGGELRPDRTEFMTLDFFHPAHLPAVMPRYSRMLRDAIAGRAEASFD